jgi:hypothetical protein
MISPAAWRELSTQGELLNDLEGVRIANDNRIRSLREDLGLADDDKSMVTATLIAKSLAEAEKLATQELRSLLKATSLRSWIKETVGVGEKQGARLLAVIGNPCWRFDNEADEFVPRSIAQLWSYCGYAVVNGRAPARTRGHQANWNTEARTRAYLIAESCIKHATSPYRKVYDEGRAKYQDSTHSVECKRCGPSGNPAKAGSPLSDGHKHARAMRLVAKAVLKDLWLAARDAEEDLDRASIHAIPKVVPPGQLQDAEIAA